jgi:hypothetical protein
MSDINGVTVRIVADSEDDAADIALLTRRLRSALLDLDVQDVEPVTGEAPAGSKGGLTEVLGWLFVTIGGEAIKVIVDRIADSALNFGREIDVTVNGQTLHLKRATREQQERAYQEWLTRVNAADGELPQPSQQERGYL